MKVWRTFPWTKPSRSRIARRENREPKASRRIRACFRSMVPNVAPSWLKPLYVAGSLVNWDPGAHISLNACGLRKCSYQDTQWSSRQCRETSLHLVGTNPNNVSIYFMTCSGQWIRRQTSQGRRQMIWIQITVFIWSIKYNNTSEKEEENHQTHHKTMLLGQ